MTTKQRKSAAKYLRQNANNDASVGGTLRTPRGDAHENPEKTNDHLGDSEDNLSQKGIGGGGEGVEGPLNTNKVIERFKEMTKRTFKPETQIQYIRIFQRFAKNINLKEYTKRQLRGKKGKELILKHIDILPKPSLRTILAVLKKVWTFGLELDWPIELKRDLGRLPKKRRGESPTDDVVTKWSNTLLHEKDTYLVLIWLLIAQFGLRPSHVCKLKWRNIRYDDNKPMAIVADGVQEDFKTSSPVAAWLPPNTRKAIETWKKAYPDPHPERLLLPRRKCNGILLLDRENEDDTIRIQWGRLRKKWDLPALRPRDMRHWVAGACRKAGLSKQASAYIMGHDPTSGGAMRDWYDTPQLQEIFTEQSDRLPNGALGTLEPPDVKVAYGLPSEAINLLKTYLSGQIGTMEFASRIENIRLKTNQILLP